VMRDSTPLGNPAVTDGSFGTGQVSVENGGAIDLNGKNLGNALNLAGSGTANSGALFNSNAAAATVVGAIALTNNASIKADGGDLVIKSAITGAHALGLSGSKQITLKDTVQVGALTSSGPGQLNVKKNITTSNGGQAYNGPTQFADALTLSATNGDIAGTGQVVTAGKLNFAINNGDVNFTNRNNQFTNTVSIAGLNGGFANNATIVNSTGLDLGATKILGNLSTTTGTGGVTGGITQSGALNIGGSSQFIADTLQNQDVVLNNPNNNFVGPVNFTGANGTKWRNINIIDSVGGLILGDVTSTGNASFGSSGGSITQSTGSSIAIGGTTTMNATSNGTTPADISLSNGGNNFGGAFNANGANVNLRDKNALVLGNITASKALKVTAGGNVTQQSGSALNIAGLTSIDSTAGIITLATSGNNFGGGLNITDSATAANAIPPRPKTSSIQTHGGSAISPPLGGLNEGGTTSGDSVSLEGDTLVITRKRPDTGTPSGMAVTISIVVIEKGKAPFVDGGLVVMDGETELTVGPFKGMSQVVTELGDVLGKFTFNVLDESGNMVGYVGTYSEEGLQISGVDSAGSKLMKVNRSLVVAIAMVELQKQKLVALDDIEVVYLKM